MEGASGGMRLCVGAALNPAARPLIRQLRCSLLSLLGAKGKPNPFSYRNFEARMSHGVGPGPIRANLWKMDSGLRLRRIRERVCARIISHTRRCVVIFFQSPIAAQKSRNADTHAPLP